MCFIAPATTAINTHLHTLSLHVPIPILASGTYRKNCSTRLDSACLRADPDDWMVGGISHGPCTDSGLGGMSPRRKRRCARRVPLQLYNKFLPVHCGSARRRPTRMLALALVPDGRSRREAAEQCGMDRQTLRDWVHRYNAEGLDGLKDRVAPGRRRSLDPDQEAQEADWVRGGPDPATHGVVRWRRTGLSHLIARRFWGSRHGHAAGLGLITHERRGWGESDGEG